jgi:hypothetical protein
MILNNARVPDFIMLLYYSGCQVHGSWFTAGCLIFILVNLHRSLTINREPLNREPKLPSFYQNFVFNSVPGH